ncbi:hypothetical protein Back11_01070 [Paenibacillus baekrokdamisoli]|uniref:Uncharacterized protein n=1 Tax=Paenibacillus baekrokdamisoli TaxID=1712516 RepID=A0A3G9IKR0_9BACL|nr:DUF6463 family protein [Paenibacillus baekrokdamisoli]MBB3069266.1 succinate-acetate transporter protein [Paenibacillus baekrokdamisoli]BBH18762.1 hypothetical protein Back11_01070 [Paenibacillus baekrokdamisoli]
MRLWKYSGIYLIATGVIHNVVGLLIGWEVLGLIAQDGLINSVNNDPDRNAIVWFLSIGFFWMILGHIFHKYQKEGNQALPAIFGWYLLIFAVIGCALMPVSGIWLFFPQAIIIILAKRNK